MYERILVPIDGSSTSTKGLEEAIRLGQLTGGRLLLVHIAKLTSIALGFDANANYANDAIEMMQQAGNKLLGEAQEKVKAAGVGVETALVEGVDERVSQTIVAQATAWKADLIVLGTHGRRGVGRILLGSDAEQVLRIAPVPVLLIRAPESHSGA